MPNLWRHITDQKYCRFAHFLRSDWCVHHWLYHCDGEVGCLAAAVQSNISLIFYAHCRLALVLISMAGK